MKRKYIIISAAVLALFIIVPVVLLAVPTLRFSLFRIATELPAVATNFAIKKYAKNRNFKSGVAGLERQLSIMQWTNTSRSSMLRGVIANTEIFMGVAERPSDYAVLTPYLKRLVSDQPDLFIAQVWLGQALSHNDPKAAFRHLEEAARIVPSDNRPYRIAVGAALALGDRNMALDWCRRYSEAQFGGTRPLIYRNIFGGAGLRKLALEVSNTPGGPSRITNEGVQVGEAKTYDFDLPKRVKTDVLKLHTGILPGVRITFGEMILYGPDGQRRLGPNDLIILPRKGFILSSNRMATVSPDGDIITFRPRTGTFGMIDRVDIKMTFERLGLASLPGCDGF
jgi:hypothetical protein